MGTIKQKLDMASFSEEPEMQVIGSLTVAPAGMRKAGKIIKAVHFFLPATSRLYKAAESLTGRDEPVTPPFLKYNLPELGNFMFARVGMMPYPKHSMSHAEIPKRFRREAIIFKIDKGLVRSCRKRIDICLIKFSH